VAEYVEITIEQGATFTTTVTVSDATGQPLDLTDYTGKAQIRKSYYSTTATDFTVTIPSPINGEMVIELSADTTANITPGRYVYDVIMTDAQNEVTRLFEGTAAVTPGVTRNG
jgi:hypothetical protein